MSASRLKQVFATREGHKALVVFVTAGDPAFGDPVATALAFAQAGADVIEWGIPFSDPMADGPVIQRASERAIAKRMTLKKIMADVRRFRRKSNVPIVLMGYFQSILNYGERSFARDFAAARGDGVLLVDLPPEEANDLGDALREHCVSQIFLVAPTSEASRMAQISAQASGYLYYVSMNGVTGSALSDVAAVNAQVKRLREQSGLPIVVGFGIKDPATAKRVARFCDGVVMGSAIIEIGERAKSPAQARAKAAALIRRVKKAI